MQIPMFMPESKWVVPDMSSLPDWNQATKIGLDTETYDPFLKDLGPSIRRGGHIAGISFCLNNNPEKGYYLPIRHKGGDNLPLDAVLAYVREQSRNFTGQVVGANLSYDLDYLEEEGITFPKAAFMRDVQMADPLIYELHMSYSLDNIAKRYGVGQKDEEKLREAARVFGVSPKSGMHLLPARYVGEYAEQDAILPLKILERQEEIIERKGLWDIWNLESKVLPVLLKMRRRGVLIDTDQLQRVRDWSMLQERECVKEIQRLVGVDLGFGNAWKAEAISKALIAAEVPLAKTKTGKPNIDKLMLQNCPHPVAAQILQLRKVDKLRTTFADSVQRFMVNGRLHCTFNQIARETENGDQKGARYGRLSCTNPNLQQQPSRDEFAVMWRKIYIPEEGKLWACCDYSQQEPRWTTHFAAICKFPKADIAADKYLNDPTTDNHTMMAELTGLPRKSAKDIFLGLCYGEGGAKLCRELGLPTRWQVTKRNGKKRTQEYHEEKHQAMASILEGNSEGSYYEVAGEDGQSILDQFNEKVPYIRRLSDFAKERANKSGIIRTVGGRILNFAQKPNGQYDWTHKALNRLIQGSSADQTKTAMVAIDREMPDTFLQLQVHDEMDASVGSVAEAKQMAEIMRECVPSTKVSFKVDVEIGKNWGEIQTVE